MPFEDALAARLDLFRPSVRTLAKYLDTRPPRCVLPAYSIVVLFVEGAACAISLIFSVVAELLSLSFLLGAILRLSDYVFKSSLFRI